MKDRIKIICGDITVLEVDAIVNAANCSLLGGGGVDGAIHRKAGPALLDECRALNGCETGQAKITAGYNLPAKWVIHTVGPVWRGGQQGEEALLADCYTNSLKLAAENGIKTIAFPCISTGVYHFPFEKSCRIALDRVKNFLEENDAVDEVLLVCFSELDYQHYLSILDECSQKG